MEKTRERKEENKKVTQAPSSQLLPKRLVVHAHRSPREEQLKLAAAAVSLNVRLRSADMPVIMQERALRCARLLLDASSSSTRPSPSLLARCLKKEFDSEYGPAWHCVVGKSFGSFVTHSPGGFVYFSIDDSLCFLLFKTEVHLVTEETGPPLPVSG